MTYNAHESAQKTVTHYPQERKKITTLMYCVKYSQKLGHNISKLSSSHRFEGQHKSNSREFKTHKSNVTICNLALSHAMRTARSLRPEPCRQAVLYSNTIVMALNLFQASVVCLNLPIFP